MLLKAGNSVSNAVTKTMDCLSDDLNLPRRPGPSITPALLELNQAPEQ